MYTFQVSINRCINYTDSPVVCQSDDIIDNFFSEAKYISFYVIDNNFDLNNFQNPQTSFLSTYSYALDPQIDKIINYFIKKAEITTNDGFVMSNINKLESFLFDNLNLDVKTITQVTNVSNTLANVAFYSSMYESMSSRNYQTAVELIANINGIINLLLFAGFIVCNLENQFNISQRLGKELVNLKQQRKSMMQKSTLKESAKEKYQFQSEIKQTYDELSSPIFTKTRILDSQRKNDVPNEMKDIFRRDVPPLGLTIAKSDQVIEEIEIVKPAQILEAKNEKQSLSPKISPKKLEEDQIISEKNIDQIIIDGKITAVPQSPLVKSPTIGMTRSEREPRMEESKFEEEVRSVKSPSNKMAKEDFLKVSFSLYVWLRIKKMMGCKISGREEFFENSKKKVVEQMDLIYIYREIQEFKKFKKRMMAV